MSEVSSGIREPARRYGNLREPKLPGFGRLSAGASLFLVLAAVVLMVLCLVSLVAGLVWAVVALVAVAPAAFPRADGYGRYEAWWRARRFSSAQRAGRTRLVQGVAGATPDGECRLPGVASTVQLSSQVDAHGREFGLVHWPAADAYAVVLACSPAGFAGVDQEVCEDQVGQWAHWLGQLNTLEELVGAAVVVETTPDSGQRLDRAMRRGRLPQVAPFVEAVEEQIRAGHQVGAPTLTCRVTLTLSARVSDDEQLDRRTPSTGTRGTRGRRGESRVMVRGTAEMAEQIGDLLPAWTGSLAATGAGAGVRPCTAQEIVDATRVAFDPSVAQDVEEAQLAAAAATARRERVSATASGAAAGATSGGAAGEPADDPWAAAVAGGTGLVWSQVGPTFHVAHSDRYEHDLSVSRTWQMRNPPLGVFYAETMRTVIAPHKDIPRKRVTFLFRPESPLASAQAADADVRKALFKATQGRRAKAGAQVELEAAQQTARQEAQGSPLVRVGILVTVTATQEVGETSGPGAGAGGGQDLAEKLRRASRAVRSSLAAQARIGLRIPVGSQDMAFLTGLPLGLVPQQLARATGSSATKTSGDAA